MNQKHFWKKVPYLLIIDYYLNSHLIRIIFRVFNVNNIEKNTYRRLQQHLDSMPVGFPRAKDDLDIKVLKHLFSLEEAEIAMLLEYKPISYDIITERAKERGLEIEGLKKKLDFMNDKGIINKKALPEGGDYYFNLPLIMGFYEYQVGNLTEEFIKDVDDYFGNYFFKDEYNKTGIPQMRVIPVGESLPLDQGPLQYDDVNKIIKDLDGSIALIDCICRKSKDMINEPCKKTNLRECCLIFRGAADHYVELGHGRYIDKSKALEIIKQAEEDGLVLQPANSKNPMCICCCCGCCCVILSNQRKLPAPAKFFASNYFAEVDNEACTGCGVCEDRCNMDAISIDQDYAVINLDRCIGCGACVPTCPTEAMKLIKKKSEVLPPLNTLATYQAIKEQKDKMNLI